MIIDVSRRTIGVNFTANGVADVVVWAPEVNDVSIKIECGNKLIYLEKNIPGFWQTKTHELKPGDRYQFLINGNEYPDPASLSQPDGVHKASQATNLKDFQWGDTNWNNKPLEEYIIYELHTGTFTPEGTFAAIEKKLDYLKTLGITAIEIMPVAQFPGERNWGYDGVYPFAVQNSYGGAEALQHLVNACHQKGLAVILDVVYNHLGPEGNYLTAYGSFVTEKYKTP